MIGRSRQIVIVTLTVVMLYACLAGGGGSFSDDGASTSIYFRYPTGFTPAPFTFLIWLPIFLGAIALAIYQALPAQRDDAGLDRMGVPYAVALIANSLTPFVELGMSNIMVVTLFVALVAAYAAFARPADDVQACRFVRLPLVLFCTWAGIASVLNACQLFVSREVPVDATTASLLFIATVSAGCWAVWRTGELGIAMVIIWAGLGIAAGQAKAGPLLPVITLASSCIAVLALRCGDWTVLWRRD